MKSCKGKARSAETAAAGAVRSGPDSLSTPEPRGGPRRAPRHEPSFVIQKHRASRLHYDLRLEEGGVLKSWAVPKPPPETEGVRRLAVAVEDHPLEYGNFRGVIPEGEYGAGIVEIWDEGAYAPKERSPAKRVFDLKGRRLRGTFALIKLKPRERTDKNWLFFKIKQGKRER